MLLFLCIRDGSVIASTIPIIPRVIRTSAIVNAYFFILTPYVNINVFLNIIMFINTLFSILINLSIGYDTIMKDDRLLQLGQKIRYERIKNGLSQEDLEEKSLVSRRTISEIERGNADIRYTNLYQIANALNMTVSELLNFSL